MEKLKIKMVKFYQGVQVAGTSNQTSVRAIYTKTVTDPRLVSVEHSENGIMIVTELTTGESEHTLVPYNNVAYVNHVVEAEAPKAKSKS